MSIQVYIALLAWPLVTAALFASLGSRKGLCISCVSGYLLLPSIGFVIADGLPPFTKDLAISISCLIAVLIFDPIPLFRFRFRWFDAFPLVAFVGWGMSALLNGLGVQEALLNWWWYAMFAGVTYLLGRCYLVGPQGLRDLALTIVAGTLVYAIPVLFEMRFSPQLNYNLYRFQSFAFWETKRDLQIGGLAIGGFRPRVFLSTGLALAIWMAAGTVVAWALWLGGHRSRILKLQLPFIAVALAIITILCRGTGAFVLMGAAIATLFAMKRMRLKAAMLWIPAAVVLYISTALVGSFLPIREPLVVGSSMLFGDTRADSLETRFRHEKLLVAKALGAPVFGWGGFGRNRVEDSIAVEELGKTIITDGFWIITLGQRGLVGLIGTWGWMILPATLSVLWAIRIKAPPPLLYLVVGLSGWSTLFALDQLLNGFTHPIQGLTAGALGSFVALVQRHRPAPTSDVRGGGNAMDRGVRPTPPRGLRPAKGSRSEPIRASRS